jgi:NAD(P)-dependent dehydrogenase (short-subunit alcohol dehydrogenase family)
MMNQVITQPSVNQYGPHLLEDKVCLITGAANINSIGYATVELFAAHGAKIAILDLPMGEDKKNLITEALRAKIGHHPDLYFIDCDLVQVGECALATQMVIEKFGRIDCLVNCAGIVQTEGMLNITEAGFDQIIDVNLKGTFNICQSVLKVFVKQQSGVIVNLSSLAAQRGGGLVGGAHYAASKGGVISLTRSIAREFASMGIRANLICPAMIDTGMLNSLDKEQIAQLTQSIPLGRLGKPIHVAGACLFLASELSAFITGATIDVNGGLHIH